jgi:hypothetical protein
VRFAISWTSWIFLCTVSAAGVFSGTTGWFPVVPDCSLSFLELRTSQSEDATAVPLYYALGDNNFSFP